LLGPLKVVYIKVNPDPIEQLSIVAAERFDATDTPAVCAMSVSDTEG
jgi:hypothetical protein